MVDKKAERERVANWRLRKGLPIGPPKVVTPFHMLARTCRKCGELISTSDLSKFIRIKGVPGFKCATCESRRRKEIRERYIKERPGFLESERARTSKRLRKANNESLAHAVNNGKEWTGPELEYVSREGISIREASKTLGRSFAAVNTMRKKVRSDPKMIRLAGLRSSVSDPDAKV